MKRLLLATRNRYKQLLFGAVFRRHGFDVRTLRDAQIEAPSGREVGQTPLENALAKAR